MIKHLVHTVLAVIAMFICAIAGFFIPALWQGVGGRDIRLQLTMMAILILIVGIAFRRALRWHALDFVFGFLAAEFLTLCIVGLFSRYTGSELFCWFNLKWLAFMSIFVGLPWLVGLGVGSLWLKISERHV